MLGVVLTLLIGIYLALLTQSTARQFLSNLDPAAQFGIAGLIGLGSFGTITFFWGITGMSLLIPLAGMFIVLSALIIRDGNAFREIKPRLRTSLPKGPDLLFPLAIGLGLLMALAGVLAPSTPMDWDSLAYHLAVPKLWLEAGKIDVIPYIHQSNFPFAVDSLFLLGLKWGGQAGAKMFVWLYTLLGVITIFGLARQRYGQRAGWWASLVFATVPIVLWQSGTAYIDVAHGLYAGLGLIFACWWLESDDSKHAWLSAILLSFAAGTKYTGLQTIAVAGLVALVGAVLLKRNLKPVLVIGLASLALASPWYIKNALWKDNPVFPFFYSKLGGKDWDKRRAAIYTNEQNTFGVGREIPPEGSLQPQRLGHSILGLAYQPGRYVNPQQTMGNGDPMGAIGIAIIGALLLGMFAGQKERFERALVAGILVSLGIWFVLTQQSRYIVTLSVPLALIAGQLTTRKGYAPLMASLAGVQTLASLYILHSDRFSDQMQVVTGKVSQEEYQTGHSGGFYAPAQYINKLGKTIKVALYDEVFGLYLDVPYYWANPGHSTQIPYDAMSTGEDYASRMKEMGFTHAYLNLNTLVKDPVLAAEMVASFQGQPFPQERKAQLMSSWEQKFNPLIVDAVQTGKMSIEQVFGNPERPRSVLLRFNP